MNNIIGNFVAVLRRYKMAGILNILGMSAAFAAFLILMMKLGYELGYDKFHPDSDRIYKLEVYSAEQGATYDVLARGIINTFINSSPHIVEGTALMPAWGGASYFTCIHQGERVGFLNKIFQVDPSATKIFGFKMVEGDANCLSRPNNILIPKSIAERFIGPDPVGKAITCNDDLWGNFYAPAELVIGGVYEDFPSNSLMENEFYYSILPNFQIASYNAANFMCFVKLDDPSHAGQVCENFVANFHEESWQKPTTASLILLSDLYLNNPETRSTVVLLIIIAFLIIIIAAVNFTNFATSLAPLRMKSINTMKIMGAERSSLRWSLIFEGIFMTLLSLIIGLLIVFCAEQTHLLSAFLDNLKLSYNLLPLGITAVIAIIIGLIAGIWPAFYITSIPPMMAIQGSFGLSPRGRRLRTLLVSLQFIVSFGLIISTFCINRQNNYLLNADVGFNHDNVAVVKLSSAHMQKKDYFVNTLKSNSIVEDVAFSSAIIGAGDTFTTESYSYNGESSSSSFSIGVSSNFLNMMDIELVDGRWATQSEEENNAGKAIITKKGQLEQNVIPETPIEYYKANEVVGIVEDINISSLRQDMINTIFIVSDNLPIAYVKFAPTASHREVTELISSVLEQIDPTYPITVDFYDGLIDKLYSNEKDTGRVIGSFGFLAIIISIMGVFGMVVFETHYRKKEIGIRKIMGSTEYQILRMFNIKYLIITVICCILASPIAYYLIDKWMNNFSYHIPIPWWAFVSAFLIVTAVTLFTVTIQSWRAATANPVESIRTE